VGVVPVPCFRECLDATWLASEITRPVGRFTTVVCWPTKTNATTNNVDRLGGRLFFSKHRQWGLCDKSAAAITTTAAGAATVEAVVESNHQVGGTGRWAAVWPNTATNVRLRLKAGDVNIGECDPRLLVVCNITTASVGVATVARRIHHRHGSFATVSGGGLNIPADCNATVPAASPARRRHRELWPRGSVTRNAIMTSRSCWRTTITSLSSPNHIQRVFTARARAGGAVCPRRSITAAHRGGRYSGCWRWSVVLPLSDANCQAILCRMGGGGGGGGGGVGGGLRGARSFAGEAANIPGENLELQIQAKKNTNKNPKHKQQQPTPHHQLHPNPH